MRVVKITNGQNFSALADSRYRICFDGQTVPSFVCYPIAQLIVGHSGLSAWIFFTQHEVPLEQWHRRWPRLAWGGIIASLGPDFKRSHCAKTQRLSGQKHATPWFECPTSRKNNASDCGRLLRNCTVMAVVSSRDMSK